MHICWDQWTSSGCVEVRFCHWKSTARKGQRGKLHMLPLEQVLQYAQDDVRLVLQIYERQRASSTPAFTHAGVSPVPTHVLRQ